MAKKSCTKGYKCGGSCISVTYACRKELAEGVSVSIDGARKVIMQDSSSVEPKDTALEGKDKEKMKAALEGIPNSRAMVGPYMARVSTDVGEDSVMSSVSKPSGEKAWVVIFKVNGDFDADPNMSPERKRRLGRVARKQLLTIIKNLPDGSALLQSPWEDDGKGEAREKAYTRAGFRMSDTGIGFALVKNGKLVSPTEGQINVIESNEFQESKVEGLTEAVVYQMIFGDEFDG